MKRLLFLLSALLFAACSAEPQTVTVQETVEVPVTVEVVSEVEVTRLVEVEVVQEVEVTRVVETIITTTPGPTQTPLIEVATPTPTPTSAVLLELEGAGNQVTDNYDWGACDKTVLFWTAAGRDNMIVTLRKIGLDQTGTLVNEIGPGEGESLLTLLGGTYYLQVEGPSEGWTLTLECQD